MSYSHIYSMTNNGTLFSKQQFLSTVFEFNRIYNKINRCTVAESSKRFKAILIVREEHKTSSRIGAELN